MSQEQHPQHGGEGKAPHRAEAFGAMRRSEARTHGTLAHLTQGQATGRSRNNSNLEEGTSGNNWTRKPQRTTRGGREQRRAKTGEKTNRQNTAHSRDRAKQ